MLETEFTFNFTEPIKAGKVTVGYFDGVHPSIVAVTRADKIFVHNPHNRSVYTSTQNDKQQQNDKPQMDHQLASTGGGNDLNFFNINQTITCLAAGSIALSLNASGQSEESKGFVGEHHNSGPTIQSRKSIRHKNQLNNDVLVVGTKTSIHVYDILHNSDLYYKEIADGANALVIGQFGKVADGHNIAMVGGDCAIHGYDREGNDVYWTVTGDNITAMALVDVDNDGLNELVAGSEDCEIQVFKKDAIVCELSETDKVACLCSLGPQIFAYALANGTVGVYQTNGERLWRIKSKNQAICMLGYDINQDGQIELLTGWSNGKLDIRVAYTGEVLYRENFKSCIAGVMIADYNMDGKQELIVCTVQGEVVGFRMENHEKQQQAVTANFEQEIIRELMKRKQTLMQELRNYEENARLQNVTDPPLILNRGKVLGEKGDQYGAIPANTKIKSSLALKKDDQTGNGGVIELKLETTNDTEIRAVVVFAEGIFEHESTVVYPPNELVNNEIAVNLKPPKDIAIDLHAKALVGYQASAHFHVFEIARHLPRFSMYGFVRNVNLSKGDNELMQLDYMTPNATATTTNNKTNNWIQQTFDAFDEDNIFPNQPSSSQQLDTTDESISNQKEWDQSYYSPNNTVSSTFFQAEVHQPQSYVIIRLVEPLSKMMEWINSNFLLEREFELTEEERRLEFVSLRNQMALIIEFRREEMIDASEENINKESSNNGRIFTDQFLVSSKSVDQTSDNEESSLNGDSFTVAHNNNRINSSSIQNEEEFDNTQSSVYFSNFTKKNSVTIYCDSMELAGTCIQSLVADHLSLSDVPCAKANFPEDFSKLKQLIDRVEEIQSVRQHLVAEVADSANLIRSAVVQAEDARLIEEYEKLKEVYSDLSMLNRDILREHTIRCQNHQDLVKSLKEINVIIQRASNLRVGSYKSLLISTCRDAIKQKNFAQLLKIISED